ncbi:MAG: MupA/Atu3671 family FMN-dependent luciferase-like monooxygenase [Pyrinomonadaceae bacterium]
MQSMRGREEEEVEDEAVMAAAVGEMYVNGVEVEWEQYYEGERRVRVGLPTYQFERERYWVEAMKRAVVVESREGAEEEEEGKRVTKRNEGEAKKADLAQWFYLPVWKRSLVAARDAEGQKLNWLVFVGESGIGELLVKRLLEAGHAVVSVVAGNVFNKINENVYSVNAGERVDYSRLLQELDAAGRTPERVVHLWSVTENEGLVSSEESFGKAQERGFYSLLYLAQALASRNVAADVEIVAVTSNMQAVTGVEALRPEKATVLGPCKVIPQEHINIKCRSVDVDATTPGTWQEERLSRQLLAELTGNATETVVAYRGGQRWTQSFEPVDMGNGEGRTARLREEGVYLITGGLGNIGLALAEHLAKTVRAKLILTGRTVLPAREEWEAWLAGHHRADRVSEKIRKIRALEEMGAEVMFAVADVGDEEQMRQLIAAAQNRFGPVNGVIHAAGITGLKSFRLVQEIEDAECEQHFRAKARGLYVLESVLRGCELDFCLLFSSISSILGGLGFVAYAAANSFMDTFAFMHQQTHPLPWVSINWDGWQLEETEQAGDALISADGFSLTVEEGVRAIQKVLSAEAVTQVVVSTGDLQARIKQWVDLESLGRKEEAGEPKKGVAYARPELANSFVAPTGQLEQEIAAVWRDLLGIEQIGIHDSFFELGGDSLVATQLVSRLRKKFQSTLTLRNFYEMPSIAGLASLIEKLRDEGAQNQDVAIVAVSRDARRMKRPAQGQKTKTEAALKVSSPEVSPPLSGISTVVPGQSSSVDGEQARKEMEFSLFFFSTDELKTTDNKYRLLIESAKFADAHGFTAVWTPERHFHAFGGLYPSPAVTSTALAMVTERTQIRAGSVVLPLQNPVRVAEEWAVIDNLSNGRVGVSFASGWHSNDFVLSPDNYAKRRNIMYDGIETVQRLWRGETIKLPNGAGHDIEVRIFPRPIQPRLPIWITANSTQTFVKAGEMGAHVLTSLLSQDVETLAENIKLYRGALARHGHQTAHGQVALMLHTYIGDDLDTVKAKAKAEYSVYLRTNLELQANHGKGLGIDVDMQEYTEGDIETIISNKFEHLFKTDGLIGTPETCLAMVERLKAIGVDEVACLIDFVLDIDALLDGLKYIELLKELSNERVYSGAHPNGD